MSELAKRLRGMAHMELTLLAGSDDQDEAVEHGNIAADLLAAAEIVERAEWRPIAEAPKDRGFEAVHQPSGFVRVVRWHESGVWILLGTGDVFYALDYFTHYRPLPAPPEVKP